eukprot:3870790-Prymnesium_polylepis.3
MSNDKHLARGTRGVSLVSASLKRSARDKLRAREVPRPSGAPLDARGNQGILAASLRRAP